LAIIGYYCVPTSGTSGSPTFDIEGQTFDIRVTESKVGPSMSLYYDIEGATFDIEGRKMTFDIGYDITTQYRMFQV
jgi:hypothetical protein